MSPLDIWEKGVPLSKAARRFGKKEIIAELNELRTQSSFPTFIEQMNQNLKGGEKGTAAVINAFGKIKPDAQHADEIQNKLQSEMLRLIQKGEIVAYGYSYPRQILDVPQKVPSELWDKPINWEKDSLQANGLRLDAIRLIPTKWIKSHSSVDGESMDLPRPKGRPSRTAHIHEAFHSLDQEGLIDYDKPMRACYPIIRNWINKHYPDKEQGDWGMNDKTLAREINPLILKQKQKQKNSAEN